MEKIVEFELYCSKCKHYDSSDADDPCDYCLSVPARENSRRPIKYEENKKTVKKTKERK
jgi:hypothetical protein